MSVSSAIESLKPIAQGALDVIKAFTGSPEDAANDSKIGQAVDILVAVVPLFEGWAQGEHITQSDVENAFGEMDEARDAFRAEIEKQKAEGG